MVAASLVAERWLSSKYAGTVTTASATGSPRKASASRLILPSRKAESCSGVNSLLRRGLADHHRAAGRDRDVAGKGLAAEAHPFGARNQHRPAAAQHRRGGVR